MTGPRGKLCRQDSTGTWKVLENNSENVITDYNFLVIDLFDAGEFSSLRKTNGNGYSNVRTLAGKSLI